MALLFSRSLHTIVPMKLSEKGRFAPPPKLPRYSQQVSETLATWPDVLARTHWELGDERRVDGADFYVGEEELGHLHLYDEAHVAMHPKLAAAVIAAGLAQRSPWTAEVVEHDVAGPADVKQVLWLFELSYDRLRGAKVTELLARIRGGAARF